MTLTGRADHANSCATPLLSLSCRSPLLIPGNGVQYRDVWHAMTSRKEKGGYHVVTPDSKVIIANVRPFIRN